MVEPAAYGEAINLLTVRWLAIPAAASRPAVPDLLGCDRLDRGGDVLQLGYLKKGARRLLEIRATRGLAKG